MDADVTLAKDLMNSSTLPPNVARDIFNDPRIGMAGGLAVDVNGHQVPFNYGPRFTIAAHVGGALQKHAYKLAVQGKTEQAQALRARFPGFLASYPDTTLVPAIHGLPPARDVHWNVGLNMFIPVEILERAGGFPDWRFHEIQAVAHHLERMKNMECVGLRRRFDPRVTVIHHGEGASSHTRAQLVASLRLIPLVGLRNFLFGSADFPAPSSQPTTPPNV